VCDSQEKDFRKGQVKSNSYSWGLSFLPTQFKFWELKAIIFRNILCSICANCKNATFIGKYIAFFDLEVCFVALVP
jgi:hypothetical protein